MDCYWASPGALQGFNFTAGAVSLSANSVEMRRLPWFRQRRGRESRAHQDSIRAPGTESWTWYPSRTANEAAVTAASKAAFLGLDLPIGSSSCLRRQVPARATHSYMA